MWVWSLGQEDPLEGGKATHSSILAWRISLTEELGGQQSVASHKVGYDWARPSLVAQMIKNLPAVQETRVWLLGWENPLEKGMATHSSILAWWIDRGAWWATVRAVTKSDMIEWLTYFLLLILCSFWSDRRCRSLAWCWTTSPPQYHLTQNRQEMSTRMLLGSGETIYSLRFSSSRVINRTYVLLVVLAGLLPHLLSSLYIYIFKLPVQSIPFQIHFLTGSLILCNEKAIDVVYTTHTHTHTQWNLLFCRTK